MNILSVKIEIPAEANLIFGQSHFIKTVEDLYEILIASGTAIKFGLAFSEASGPCLVRSDGNDADLRKKAEQELLKISAGHSFLIFLKNGFPINVLNQIKNCPEVCRIFCATANPVEVILAETEEGRAVLGVVDGLKPKGIEMAEDVAKRKELLRKIGYKR
ncbi:MAG: adenosine-specific kinase [candidate division Zixibacteria bacterium]|nr:adenosine-specific kinase [candidate division Zixibacteria bacterium]MCI0597228.1 adenosine-specific kinase [candidate division Zixibacteria bacterium]